MFLTIIIPSLNQSKFIKECLDSIVTQKTKKFDFEVIIYDNFSNDNTEEIVKKYQTIHKNIKFFKEKDNCQAEAINKGIRNARGKYVTWQNCDDFYNYNEAFIDFFQCAEATTAAEIIYSDLNLVDINSNFLRVNKFYNVNFFHLLSEGMLIANQSCIFKKVLFEKYNKITEQRNSFDYELFLRFSKNNVIFKKLENNKSIGSLRVYNEQISQNYNTHDYEYRINMIKNYHKNSMYKYFDLKILRLISKIIRFFVYLKHLEFQYILNGFKKIFKKK